MVANTNLFHQGMLQKQVIYRQLKAAQIVVGSNPQRRKTFLCEKFYGHKIL